ncbi:IS91 family transposase, partial [Brumimicrobium oceani]|uniref:IS91 family transposase n=1 Tax=Brumimicrobium oceani TaxID=2100725 RepID=UPI001E4D3483
LFNVKSMSTVFRAKFIALLRKSELKIQQSVYDKVFSKKWVVYAKQPFFKPEFVIEYLGRYTHKIAISNHRIKSIDYAKKTVTFSAKNYRKGGQKHNIKLKSTDFVKRFSLHILPKGFTRIRHFGILSSSWKKVKLPELQRLLNEENTAEIIKENPTHLRRCPICKKGKLITVLFFDGRGPPKNWKKTLSVSKPVK